ncbi:MAG: hypothetical protein H0V44_15285 [Planctomycetes bacterium]|nr:hypothetical protein [Planctomycetota bacterium]
MSHAADIECILRTIAASALERRPLGPDLRAQCGALGKMIADELDAGKDVASALSGHLPDELRAALRGPRPSLERSALLTAERLRLDRAARLAWIDAIAHPLLTMIGVVVAVVVILRVSGHGFAAPWLIVGIGVLIVGAAVVWLSQSPYAARWLPSLASLGYHMSQSQRFERAALVARWRLPESELIPVLGSDAAGLGTVLRHPEAEHHCRQLADYHASAAVRSRRHMVRILSGIVYVVAGALLLSAAVEPMAGLVDALCAMNDME